jgi:hypothetical protein
VTGSEVGKRKRTSLINLRLQVGWRQFRRRGRCLPVCCPLSAGGVAGLVWGGEVGLLSDIASMSPKLISDQGEAQDEDEDWTEGTGEENASILQGISTGGANGNCDSFRDAGNDR